MYKNILFINSSVDTFIWKKKINIKILSLYKKFFLGGYKYITKKKNFFFDKATSSFCSKSFLSKKVKKLNNIYNISFLNLNYFFFKKFKFTGKGYKIKKVKNKKSFQFFFGYSHKIFLVSGGCQLRKLTKYKLFLITNNKKKLHKISTLLKLVKPVNLFTKRGLRATKQKIFKRPGKKSTY